MRLTLLAALLALLFVAGWLWSWHIMGYLLVLAFGWLAGYTYGFGTSSWVKL